MIAAWIHDLTEEAAAALRIKGHNVARGSDDLGLWLIDGEFMTSGDLVALAFRLGLMTATTERVQ